MIGIVTGSISGIDIMDTDSQEADEELQSYLSDSFVCPTQRTPGGGKHYLFTHAEGIRNSNDRSPFKFHVRGEGGYFIAPPSENGNGGCYQWLDGLSIQEVTPPPMPNTLYNSLINAFREGERHFKTSEEEHTNPHEPTRTHKILTLGRRDNDLFHTANALINARTPIEEVEQYLEILAENSNPPFPLSEISEKIKSALKRVERRDRNIAQEVREWIEPTPGHFESTQIHRDLHLSTKEDLRAMSAALSRLVADGVIERYGDKRGVYRRVDKDYEVIDFINASDEIFPIKWPFNIERYVEICPGNPIIIAGEKDAGKTALLLNCVQMNMNVHRIFFFSSEMGDRESKKRLLKFGIPLKQWKFTMIERSSNFSDVIQPDDINIIDFLEVYQDFYKIGLYIREICDKLNKGIAIIALQKNPGVDWGLGGMRSMEKARLYLSIEKGRIKIVSGKNWASETNPVGLQLDFKLVQGCKFIIQKEWYKA
jgi:DNA-binding transcriptional ArsR family regulator